MNKYEELLDKADREGIAVDEDYPFSGNTSGLYIDGNIALSDKLNTTAEKSCVLAEELGHHYTSFGNIVDLTNVNSRKQERQARLFAYNMQIGLSGIIRAFEYGCQNTYEIAEYLEVTVAFLEDAIDCYRRKYGSGIIVDHYYIMLIPNVQILKTF